MDNPGSMLRAFRKQNTQRRCIDIQTKTEVRQSRLHTDSTWNRQSKTKNDNADQLWQNVFNQNTSNWSTQCSGCKVKLTVTIHHNKVTNVTCHNHPSEADQGNAHDGEALTNQKCNQSHVKNHWYVVDQVVKLCEEAVELTNITPQTTDCDTQCTFTNCYDQSKFDGCLGSVPYLTPIVTTDVIGTKPIFGVRADKCFCTVSYKVCIVVFTDCKSNKRENNQCKENDT